MWFSLIHVSFFLLKRQKIWEENGVFVGLFEMFCWNREDLFMFQLYLFIQIDSNFNNNFSIDKFFQVNSQDHH